MGPLFILLVLELLTRNVYAAPGRFMRVVQITGGLAGAIAGVPLLRSVPWHRADGPLTRLLGSVAIGAVWGFIIACLALDLLARETATQVRTVQVPYAVTSGWKNCGYGIAFDDEALRGRITVCGPRWHLPRQPDTGMLHVTETVGPWGVILNQVSLAVHP
ncbi:hypothetical protein [Paraburkholderia pallida]|uniref:Uncharacterized protein n=1 Tax=Paraburkholderia pallida TaxID=2547399 RepID=A0A4P7D3W6_9BURK|nr:hypothetical protein [Paraburkholderia pallida]QBR01234.1 hypothetical protein E1956_28905 [Paraburkholderia pallida]